MRLAPAWPNCYYQRSKLERQGMGSCNVLRWWLLDFYSRWWCVLISIPVSILLVYGVWWWDSIKRFCYCFRWLIFWRLLLFWSWGWVIFSFCYRWYWVFLDTSLIFWCSHSAHFLSERRIAILFESTFICFIWGEPIRFVACLKEWCCFGFHRLFCPCLWCGFFAFLI